MQPRTIVLGVALAFTAGLLATTARGEEEKKPPEKVIIKDCQTKKPPVVFPHKAHIAAFKKLGIEKKCKDCHHNDSKIGQKCGDCHKDKEQKGIGKCTSSSPKKNPFHVRCRGCHKQLKKDKPDIKVGPTKCKECHKKEG
jgi:hypothetical protein